MRSVVGRVLVAASSALALMWPVAAPSPAAGAGSAASVRPGMVSAGSVAATVRITVPRSNTAPVARPDAFTTRQAVALAVPAPGVLGNDADSDGDPLSAALVSGPTAVTLTLGANGSFRYVPRTGFAGLDRFTYRAGDGLLRSRAVTVTLRVNALPTCRGRSATLVGTTGADVLQGSPRPDVIVALGGNDVVSGRGGSDVVCGGAGNDRVLGGAGDDLLVGGPGIDTLLGGPGRNRLIHGN